MRKILMTMAAATMALAMALPVAAQVNVRQLNQERRIDAGVRSGKLSRSEAVRLKAQQRGVQRLEAQLRAKHGGRLTAADKRMIHDRQAEADRAITHQKHDRQRGRNHLPF